MGYMPEGNEGYNLFLAKNKPKIINFVAFLTGKTSK